MNFGTFVSTNYNVANNFPDKHEVDSKEVSMTLLSAKQVLDTYRISFALSISYQSTNPNNAGRMLTAHNVDMKSLEDAVWDKIDSQDKDYLILVRLTTREVIFDFNYEKWFDEATRGVGGSFSAVTFNKTITFKKRVPKIIMYDIMRNNFSNFVENRFRKYVIDKKLDTRWFRNIFRNQRMRRFTANMFHYDYDIQFNRLSMSLKPQYIMIFLFGLTRLTARERSNISYHDFEKEFEDKTRRRLTAFEKDVYKKFLRTGKTF